MPLRKELLDICQRIQDEYDPKKLAELLDELTRVLDDEKQVMSQTPAKNPFLSA